MGLSFNAAGSKAGSSAALPLTGTWAFGLCIHGTYSCASRTASYTIELGAGLTDTRGPIAASFGGVAMLPLLGQVHCSVHQSLQFALVPPAARQMYQEIMLSDH